MRRAFAALFPPIDPVVAVHASSVDADATLRTLGRAGYGRGMLAVVGQADASRAADKFPPELVRAQTNWAASGLAWGFIWAALTVAATLTVSAGSSSAAILLLLGATVLLLHVVIAWRAVAPQPDTSNRSSIRRSGGDAHLSHVSSCRFLVLVRGSRSDIALARTILAH